MSFRGGAGTLLLGCGLVAAFSVLPAQARGFKVIYSFKGGSDGVSPSGMGRERGGLIYGATPEGGANGEGTVFQISHGTEAVLHSFAGGSDGASPDAPPVADKAGNLYGTTYYGGASNAGTVYEVASDGTESVLYSFTGGNDGANPVSSLMVDGAGNLYGTTPYGGSNGLGVVFELSPGGAETVLHTFAGGGDAAFPYAGLIEDAAGNFYGTGSSGGANGYGAVFEIAAGGAESVLYSFAGGSDGFIPNSGLTRDKSGNLYGTTYEGGTGNCGGGCGTVFEVAAGGGETVLHDFAGGTTDGAYPYAGVVFDKAGNLYSTAYEGGAYGYGIVFKLAPDGTETLLHSFSGGNDGGNPDANLVANRKGVLYSTAAGGGANGDGTVFRLKE